MSNNHVYSAMDVAMLNFNGKHAGPRIDEIREQGRRLTALYVRRKSTGREPGCEWFKFQFDRENRDIRARVGRR